VIDEYHWRRTHGLLLYSLHPNATTATREVKTRRTPAMTRSRPGSGAAVAIMALEPPQPLDPFQPRPTRKPAQCRGDVAFDSSSSS
jgi:hypothetical protein